MQGFGNHLRNFEAYLYLEDKELYEACCLKIDGYSIMEIVF